MAESSSKNSMWGMIIVAAITALATYLGTRQASDSQNRATMVDYQSGLVSRIAALERDYDTTRQAKLDLEIMYGKSQLEIVRLKAQRVQDYEGMYVLRRYIQQAPLAMWLKLGPELRMVTVNKAYTDLFGVSNDEYVGATDFDIWPQETAELFRRRDLAVIEAGKGLFAIEEVPVDHDDPDSELKKWIIIKYPVIINMQNGVAGIAFSMDRLRQTDTEYIHDIDGEVLK